MTKYMLKRDVVQSAVAEISQQKINSVFAGYLGVKRAYQKQGEDSDNFDASFNGVKWDLHEYFNRYYRLDGRDDAHFVPFTEKSASLEKNLWLKHAPGTYTPSSAPPGFRKVVEISGSRSNAQYKLKEESGKPHWEVAHGDLCDDDLVPADAVAVFLYRDFTFDVEDTDEETGDEEEQATETSEDTDDKVTPTEDDLLEYFRDEFGYEQGGTEYDHLYSEGKLGISQDSFNEYDEN